MNRLSRLACDSEDEIQDCIFISPVSTKMSANSENKL